MQRALLAFLTIGIFSYGPLLHAQSSWYVDNRVSGGSNNGTSWANAWSSLAAVNWSNIHGGDTLYISGGSTSQTYTETWAVGAGGFAGSPITITAGANSPSPSGHSGTVIFDYSACAPSCTSTAITVNQNYVRLEGANTSTHASVMQLNNLYNTGGGTNSVGISGAGPNTGLVIDGWTFTNDNNPIRLNQSNGVTISNNLFSGARGDANIAMGAPYSAGAFGLNKVFGNDFETYVHCAAVPCTASPTGGPDGVQNGGNEDIYNNIFHVIATTQATSGQHPDMIEPVGNFMRIYNNEFRNVGDSWIDRDCWYDQNPNNIWIYNNLFHITDNIGSYPVAFRVYCSASSMGSLTNIKIWNNTMADNTVGGAAQFQFGFYNGGNPTATGIEFRNNIFYNVGNGGGAKAIQIVPSTGYVANSFTFSNNIYYASSGTIGIQFESTSSNYTAATWVASANESNSTTSQPLFVSYSPQSASNNFSLQSGDTVARNKGINLSSNFTTDKDGNPRPASPTPWDIGAYQYLVSTTSNACDLNQDGVVNSLDYSAAVNMALGVTPCTANIAGPGVCNVVVVQRVVNASLGGACLTQ